MTSYESGRLDPEAVRGMFDRITPVYDVMNRVMTAGLDQRWRRMAAERVVVPGDRVLDACCGTGDFAIADAHAGGRVTGLDFSERMLERARREGAFARVGSRRPAGLAVRGCVVRRGHRGLRRAQRRRSRRRPP